MTMFLEIRDLVTQPDRIKWVMSTACSPLTRREVGL